MPYQQTDTVGYSGFATINQKSITAELHYGEPHQIIPHIPP